jgi:hypothetical protein
MTISPQDLTALGLQWFDVWRRLSVGEDTITWRKVGSVLAPNKPSALGKAYFRYGSGRGFAIGFQLGVSLQGESAIYKSR